MKLNIYQINLDRDKQRVAFLPYERMRKYSDFDSSIYDKVYSGDIDSNRTLENIYCIFNNNPVEGFYGRSLSVSDVVEVRNGKAEEDGFYYCDSAGFIAIAFEAEKAVQGINALYIKAGCTPKMVMIPDLTGAYQQAVCGYFEVLQPWNDEAAIICNEEAVINGLEPNRVIEQDDGSFAHVIFGDFLIVGAKEGADTFSSLSEKSAEKYSKKYYWPELICRNNVNNSFVVFTRNPKSRKRIYKI